MTCNIFGIYSKNVIHPSEVSISEYSLATLENVQEIKSCARGNGDFFPLTSEPDAVMFSQCPSHHGKLEIWCDGVPLSVSKIQNHLKVNFRFSGPHIFIDSSNRYMLPTDAEPKSIQLKIKKTTHGEMGFIQITDQKNRNFFYFFSPNFLYSYNIDKSCGTPSDPVLEKIKSVLEQIAPPQIIIATEFYEGIQSFTLNKKKVFLCLRKPNGDYYDLNTLIYVAIHELAHVMVKDIGHTPGFHAKFDELLDEASRKGLWNRNIPVAKNYCVLN